MPHQHWRSTGLRRGLCAPPALAKTDTSAPTGERARQVGVAGDGGCGLGNAARSWLVCAGAATPALWSRHSYRSVTDRFPNTAILLPNWRCAAATWSSRRGLMAARSTAAAWACGLWGEREQTSRTPVAPEIEGYTRGRPKAWKRRRSQRWDGTEPEPKVPNLLGECQTEFRGCWNSAIVRAEINPSLIDPGEGDRRQTPARARSG
jgi:hypothetical protein